MRSGTPDTVEPDVGPIVANFWTAIIERNGTACQGLLTSLNPSSGRFFGSTGSETSADSPSTRAQGEGAYRSSSPAVSPWFNMNADATLAWIDREATCCGLIGAARGEDTSVCPLPLVQWDAAICEDMLRMY
eukprot:scaffold297172_cov51-Attheya_sp.AAC.1